MKLMNKLKERRANNKGFSLVELIIVIAIMAILVGIVGTQVVPYLNRSKESKDLQLVNSYSTAAMTAYTSNADKITIPASNKITVDVYASGLSGDEKTLADAIIKLTYADLTTLQGKMGSTTGKAVSKIEVEYDFSAKKITTKAIGTDLEPVEAEL